jgi:hypothetical protein
LGLYCDQRPALLRVGPPFENYDHILNLNYEILNYLQRSAIIRIIKSRRMRWAGHVARVREKKNAFRLLVGKPEGKRPLGRPRRRWVDNIKLDLLDICWGAVEWIGPVQNREK